MNKNILHFIIVTSAILPATLLLFLNLIVAFNFIPRIEFKSILILLVFVFGILGYIGLIMLLFLMKNKKKEALNMILLTCGICSFILFNSIEGGTRAWKWILTMEEPDEWFILVWPTLVSFGYLIIKVKRLSSVALEK